MTDSRHFKWRPLSLLWGRKSKQSFKNVIDGKVGSTAYEYTDWFLARWIGYKLAYDLDQRVGLSRA